MASPSLMRSATRSNLSVYARFALQGLPGCYNAARRWMSSQDLANGVEANKEWETLAEEVKAGHQKSMFKILEERGYIHDVTGAREQAEQLMTQKRLGAYVGIDPTASSLHVGHMLPLMALFWMFLHGHHTITLIGGATAQIGDPSGRLTTREATKQSVHVHNSARMQDQMRQLWHNVESYGGKYGYNGNCAKKGALVNNDAWWNTTTMLEVLQILGPGMRLGSMLARDTVKNKMKKGDGMSFAEFTYPILQAWDWWMMYKANNIQIQIGGSDQFGNITAGINAVKYIAANHNDDVVRGEVVEHGPPFGFTVPLLTTSSGQKFGKSAGNAVWLDVEQTSSFELYKFFLGTSDADVGKYLKMFTFMPIQQINALVEEHMKSAAQRKAQHKLAREFVELVHGEEEAAQAESQHRLFFARRMSNLKEQAIVQAKAAPNAYSPPPDSPLDASIYSREHPKAHLRLPRSIVEHSNLGRILRACGLATSSTEGHRLALGNAIYVGRRLGGSDSGEATNDNALSFTLIKTWKAEDVREFLIDDNLLIFRRGKSVIRIVQVVSDAEYEALE